MNDVGISARGSVLTLQYWIDRPFGLELRAFVDGRRLSLGALPPATRAWTDQATAFSPADRPHDMSFNSDGIQGTGASMADDVRMIDGKGEACIFVAREGYFHEQQTVFYSLNPGVYCSLNRVHEITVSGGGLIAQGAIFVDAGEWSMDGNLTEEPEIHPSSSS